MNGQQISYEDAQKALKDMKKVALKISGKYDSKLQKLSYDLNDVSKYSSNLAENLPEASKALAKLSTDFSKLGESLKSESDPALIAALDQQYKQVGEVMTALYQNLADQIKMKTAAKTLHQATKATASQLSNFKTSIVSSVTNLEAQIKAVEAAHKAQLEGKATGAYAKKKED